MRVWAAPTGSRNASATSLSGPTASRRDASSATASALRAAAHASTRAHERRYAGSSQEVSVDASMESSTMASHGPAGTSSTLSSMHPSPLNGEGMTPSYKSSSGASV